MADLTERVARAMWLTEEWFNGSGPGASRWTWERLDAATQTYWLAKAKAAVREVLAADPLRRLAREHVAAWRAYFAITGGEPASLWATFRPLAEASDRQQREEP